MALGRALWLRWLDRVMQCQCENKGELRPIQWPFMRLSLSNNLLLIIIYLGLTYKTYRITDQHTQSNALCIGLSFARFIVPLDSIRTNDSISPHGDVCWSEESDCYEWKAQWIRALVRPCFGAEFEWLDKQSEWPSEWWSTSPKRWTFATMHGLPWWYRQRGYK